MSASPVVVASVLVLSVRHIGGESVPVEVHLDVRGLRDVHAIHHIGDVAEKSIEVRHARRTLEVCVGSRRAKVELEVGVRVLLLLLLVVMVV